MTRFQTPFILVTVAAAALLSACGGSNDDPAPTPKNATLTITNASDATLNGVYSTSTLSLTDVEKVNPIGGDPETCRFRFSGLQQAGTNRLMDGDIRYIPGNTEVRVTFIAINSVEFRLQGSTNAAADRTNNEIDYTGATLTSTQGTAQTLGLTGSVPMNSGRPEGC